MKRVITSLSLLLLLLCGATAQSISQYEYWTDDDYASRTVGSATGIPVIRWRAKAQQARTPSVSICLLSTTVLTPSISRLRICWSNGVSSIVKRLISSALTLWWICWRIRWLTQAATTGTIKAGKAYLRLETAQTRDAILIDAELTGVSEVIGHSGEDIERYYNISGQRIFQPKKGLYILKGKKVIIK